MKKWFHQNIILKQALFNRKNISSKGIY